MILTVSTKELETGNWAEYRDIAWSSHIPQRTEEQHFYWVNRKTESTISTGASPVIKLIAMKSQPFTSAMDDTRVPG